MKELTRGKTSINKNDIQEFIETLKVKDEVKSELKSITPNNYTGMIADY
ncbi:MAG: hypothetical protein WKG06_36465 [Segetibacter sp.]